jgi:hypothetical protein
VTVVDPEANAAAIESRVHVVSRTLCETHNGARITRTLKELNLVWYTHKGNDSRNHFASFYDRRKLNQDLLNKHYSCLTEFE